MRRGSAFYVLLRLRFYDGAIAAASLARRKDCDCLVRFSTEAATVGADFQFDARRRTSRWSQRALRLVIFDV